MQRPLLIAIAAVALLGACNRTDTLGADRPPQTPAPDAPAPPVASADAPPAEPPGANTTAGLVARLAQGDMFEIEAGRLALQRSTSDPVKAFAQSMVDAHTASAQDLRAQLTAAHLDITAPVDLDRAHSDLSADLRSAEPAAFDATYLNQQVQAHEEGLSLLQGYARNGDNAALRAWATRQAETVQGHLTAARALASGAETPAATGSASGPPSAESGLAASASGASGSAAAAPPAR